jgi:4-hydroxy-4-methyl-2-oxoglutarate aldolase
MTIKPETLERLGQFDTPTICNTIELFDLQPRTFGYSGRRIQSCYPELPPAVGFASTASFRASAPGGVGSAYAGIEAQLENFQALPGPAMVVIQDLDHPVVAAVFGEVMCSTYKAFNAAGLITNGAGRDLLQVRALNFPVFTGGTICSHGYCHLMHVGLPVTMDGLVINQGDLVHADANGVALIPIAVAAQVARLAGEFVEAEEIIMEYVKAEGSKQISEYEDRRHAFQKRIGELRAEATEAASLIVLD